MDLEDNSSNEENQVTKSSLKNTNDMSTNSDVSVNEKENEDTVLEPQNKEEPVKIEEPIKKEKTEEEKTAEIIKEGHIDPMIDYESISSSDDIEIPPLLIDQVIGHEEAVETIKKAAKQRRNVLLIGDPGVGKSMLAKGMSELLPPEVLEDVLVYPNMEDQNNPLIRTVPAGEGIKIVKSTKTSSSIYEQKKSLIMMVVVAVIIALGFFYNAILEAIIAAAFIFLIALQIKPKNHNSSPKLLVNNANRRFAPFFDATGAHAGALLGDVRHDPYQSGGLGTPAHERVEAGMIHKANKGVLYIDEIGTMSMKTQQELLSAMQENKYSITGQSENSSGAMVRSQAVPCDFVLVASGNIKVLEGMHIALRSRIRGYGYEIFMKDTMDDTPENRKKLARFVAQEVKNDGRIPPFDTSAIDQIILEAKRRAGKKNALTLKLRDLGGLVRSSGDVAKEEGAKKVSEEHVLKAKKYARTLEEQMADMSIQMRKEYSMINSTGGKIGVVNGLAIIGDRSGIVMPIAAQMAPASSKNEGKIIVTGKLGEIAQDSVQNVSAIIKKYTQKDISNYDIHVQFLQSYDGVEGDSASVSITAAVISAVEGIPIDQSMALTGSLTVRGDVMPIGGATGKIEAAAEAGIKKVLIPKSNMGDVMIEDKYKDMIEIIPVETIDDVLDNILLNGSRKEKLMSKIKKIRESVSDSVSESLSINSPQLH